MSTKPTLNYEKELWGNGITRVAGVDEVGRGCLAGYVLSVAVCLPCDFDAELLEGINDSKKLSAKKRESFFSKIMRLKEEGKLAVGVGAASACEIDKINIRRATALAMKRAIERLGQVEHVLVDGLPVPELGANQLAIVKGDSHCLSIAAASVVAKVIRDRGMVKLSLKYPDYGWSDNAGYGTKPHLNGIRQKGLSPHHRKSFKTSVDENPLF